MPTLRESQTNFSGGEASPKLVARSDTKFYSNGAESLLNMEMLYEGGVQTRPPLVYRATIPFAPYRLAAFVFSETQRYLISFSDGRADIFDGTLTVVATLTSAPWTLAMLAELNWTQFGDTMFLVHEDMPMQVVKRTGATTFVREVYEFEDDDEGDFTYQPYYKFADADMTLQASPGNTGSQTLTASAPGFFTANHVGRTIRMVGQGGLARPTIDITAVTNATTATGTPRQSLGTQIGVAFPTRDWDEEAFGAEHGYARSVEFFGDRLIFGGSRDLPSRIWFSKIGAYFNFDLGNGEKNEAIWDGVASRRVSNIKHLLGFRHLLIFADRALFFVPQSAARPLTPENFQLIEQQPYGIGQPRPALFDGANLYVQSSGTTVREGFWVDTDQAYQAESVSGVSSHLISAPIDADVTYGSQEGQEQHAYFVNDDGTLAVFTSVRDQDVAGWAPWTTEGSFEAVASWGDRVFMGVERTVDGQSVHYLEEFVQSAAPLDASGKAVSGSETRTFTDAFPQLAGETVHLVSKGHYLGTETIGGTGTLTLDDSKPAVTEIEAGFRYSWQVRPLPIDVEFKDGRTRGLMKRLVRAWLILDKSASLKIQGETILVDLQGDAISDPANTITGIREVRLLGLSREAQFTLTSDQPQRVRILGVTREVEINR